MLQQNKQSIKQAALRLLNRRGYSEKELRQKLQTQGFDDDSIYIVITFLQERGYLDDAALCAMLIDKLTASRKYSLNAIIMKLKQRGIPDSIISDHIKDCEKSFEFEAAFKIVSKRYASYNKSEQIKVSRYLMYKGFSGNTIMKVIEKLNYDI